MARANQGDPPPIPVFPTGRLDGYTVVYGRLYCVGPFAMERPTLVFRFACPSCMRGRGNSRRPRVHRHGWPQENLRLDPSPVVGHCGGGDGYIIALRPEDVRLNRAVLKDFKAKLAAYKARKATRAYPAGITLSAG